MPVNQIVALAAAVLAVVLLVRWVRSRSSRTPDLTMHRFSRALDAIAPGDAPPRGDGVDQDVDHDAGRDVDHDADRDRGHDAGASPPNAGARAGAPASRARGGDGA